MHRKQFISAAVAAAAASSVLKSSVLSEVPAPAPVTPPYLKKGATVGITCPAGFITEEEIRPALLQLMEWGFHTKVGETVGRKDLLSAAQTKSGPAIFRECSTIPMSMPLCAPAVVMAQCALLINSIFKAHQPPQMDYRLQRYHGYTLAH